jgi:putative membrane protein
MHQPLDDFDGHHAMWGHGAWWHVLLLLLLVALVALVAWVVLSRTLGRSHRTTGAGAAGAAGADPAVTTLRERFARSEITEDEYRSRLALLEGREPTSG